MKRIAHIQNNEIVSVSIADDNWIIPEGCMLESAAISLGYPFKKVEQKNKIWLSRVEFWNEFTMQEKIAIASSTSDMVKFFFAELTIWNGEVWSDDPRVQQGLDLLVSEQIITSERKQQILSK